MNDKNSRHQQRLTVRDLNKVGPEYIWNSIQSLLSGDLEHPYGPSTDYDLVVNDVSRLAPKAVFGLAASEALGFQVLPKHFVGGLASPCFRILERAGYQIVRKRGAVVTDDAKSFVEDQEWREGSLELRSHLSRERRTGLREAKKAQMKREFGQLICERCRMNPVERYGDESGEACIEVHHNETQVADMREGHMTRLEDVQCLCANCHRYLHQLLIQKKATKQKV